MNSPTYSDFFDDGDECSHHNKFNKRGDDYTQVLTTSVRRFGGNLDEIPVYLNRIQHFLLEVSSATNNRIISKIAHNFQISTLIHQDTTVVIWS